MNKFYTTVFALSLAISLPSCAYFNTESEAEMIEVSVSEPQPASSMQDYGLPDQYAERVAVKTRGSVQVFSLDGSGAGASMAPGGNVIVSTVQASQPPVSFKAKQPEGGIETYVWDKQSEGGVSPMMTGTEAFGGGEFVSVSANSGGSPLIVYFEHGSVILDESGRAKVSNMAHMFAGDAGDIFVEGHASVPSNAQEQVMQRVVNLKISMDRAFAVAKALMEAGVPAERIRTRAYGDTQPPRALDGMSAEAASRRVEVHE